MQEHEKIRTLFAQHKRLLINKKKIAPHKDPILLLLRLNNKVEYYHNVKTKKFEFKHSDGDERYILLDQAQLLTFDYGSNSFKGYIAHEDEALPYPHRPILYAQTVQVLIDKIMNDIKTWKAKELEAKGSMMWKIGAGIAIIIIAYALYKVLVPEPTQAPIIIQTLTNLTGTKPL